MADRRSYVGDVECKSALINHAAINDNTIVSAVATKKIAVFAVLVVAVGTVNVTWWDGAAGTQKTGDVNLQAREGYALAVTPPAYLWIGAANTALVLNLSAAIAVDGFVSYVELS